ncbi:unnamed protein product [Soboliphyme baturini]|uniref:Twinfilin-1 n=1 Tax=Soboliphyme baturini TaxID=241478 RepID=A0A183J089_9BILA|nr:unnamed protein product [Soboliphyme baturini]
MSAHLSYNQEQYYQTRSFKAVESWEVDYGRMSKECFEDRQPCYVLLRLDSRVGTHDDYEWLFVTFVPDDASIRQKMLYASTQMTLKKQFGNGCIKYDMHASSKACTYPNEEVMTTAVKRYISQKFLHTDQENAPDPWPSMDVANKRKSINGIDISAKRGIDFPIDNTALDALRQLRSGAINYVQLSVDTLNEAIKLEKFGVVNLVELNNDIARSKPRYHFYTFGHVHDGVQRNPIVFIYSLPTLETPIKEKMLYSSCKEPFLTNLQQTIGLTVDKKIELDDKEIVSYDFLMNELYPVVYVASTGLKFDKPKAPTQRRVQRLQKF